MKKSAVFTEMKRFLERNAINSRTMYRNIKNTYHNFRFNFDTEELVGDFVDFYYYTKTGAIVMVVYAHKRNKATNRNTNICGVYAYMYDQVCRLTIDNFFDGFAQHLNNDLFEIGTIKYFSHYVTGYEFFTNPDEVAFNDNERFVYNELSADLDTLDWSCVSFEEEKNTTENVSVNAPENKNSKKSIKNATQYCINKCTIIYYYIFKKLLILILHRKDVNLCFVACDGFMLIKSVNETW